jgi:chromosome segregation ATPase
MNKSVIAAACAAFFISAAWAQAQPGRTVSRDELRVCMDTEDSIAKRKPGIESRMKEARAEIEALKPESTELEDERRRLEQDGWPSNRQDRFERKVRAHNAKSSAANDKLAAVQKDLTALNADVRGYNEKCVGVSFLPADKEAILKEREAKK